MAFMEEKRGASLFERTETAVNVVYSAPTQSQTRAEGTSALPPVKGNQRTVGEKNKTKICTLEVYPAGIALSLSSARRRLQFSLADSLSPGSSFPQSAAV